MPNQVSYSLTFLSKEDRILLSFSQEKGNNPAPVLLTRRLVKLLGNHLRRYIEKHISLPKTVTTEGRDDLIHFMHMSELESNPPQWGQGKPKMDGVEAAGKAGLATKINLQYGEEQLKLMFYEQTVSLVSLTLDWRETHRFLYSLAEMSKKADWILEGIFEWSGKGPGEHEMGRVH